LRPRRRRPGCGQSSAARLKTGWGTGRWWRGAAGLRGRWRLRVRWAAGSRCHLRSALATAAGTGHGKSVKAAPRGAGRAGTAPWAI
jgi:hypothetical protein